MNRYVKFLYELSKDDLPLVGGKAANLGEMFNLGFPIPPAFVITCQAYRDFIEKIRREKIFGILRKDGHKGKNLEEESEI